MNNPMFDMTGDVAVVTGAGRGIGRGIAQELANAGANVVCAARRTHEIEETAELINAGPGGRAVAKATDVTSEDQMNALAQCAIDEFGRLDIWVNNAGGSLMSCPLTELPLEEWENTLRTNLTSTLLGVRAACRHFGENSRIVNISSGASLNPYPGSGHYGAAKAGVNLLTKNLAHELGPKTRVNAVLPGFIPTETVRTALDMDDEDITNHEQKLGLPAGRLGKPQDIGAAVTYLCAPASEWVTGQCLRVAGTS